ncbi:hypothetical protein CGZ93_10380 [Enemella dayhoffiae]|uniref:Uncharacterized protein n=1 Tax=Enemella dayhoffiae TaxID=2016507 RepID=A0A255H2C4_9ACTN|nr:transglycosylase SLT domain-containing protein [Enemella dayhoffiae]OYO21476.1 hypothetical protein CGZ93_10380 [Enemella dayhoffiae]
MSTPGLEPQQQSAALPAAGIAAIAVVVGSPVLLAFVLVVALVVGLTLQPPAAPPAGTCGVGALEVPERARPWMQKAAQVSGLPEGYLAAIAKQESSFDPNNFTNDSNGGTWGLFQINRAEWSRFFPTGDNPGGTPHGITDPMIHAEVGGRYLKDRLENVRRMQAKNPSAAYAKISDLDALVIAHNAGEGNLQKYPAIPSITKGYLENMHKWFRPGPCEGRAGGAGGIKPASGKVVSPIPEGVSGVIMSARYGRYPSGGPHWGVDLAKGGAGAWTFQSVCDGTVIAVKINQAYANSNGPGGSTNYLWVDCGNSVYMGYAHWYAKDLNPELKEGVRIGAGTPIAPQGNQGNSSGAHLHFQVSTSGSMAYGSSTTTDPVAYLAGLGIQLPAASY